MSPSQPVSIEATAAPSRQQALLPIYLGGLRQRFKAEVNRLTSGGMTYLLGERPHGQEMTFPLTYLYAFHWLRHNVHEAYLPKVLDTFRSPARAFLMDLLLSDSAEAFVQGYIAHWLQHQGEAPVQKQELLSLLAAHNNDPDALARALLDTWASLGLFKQDHKTIYAELARGERDRYGDMLGDADRQRLALVDALPEPTGATTRPRFAKLGIIPVMGCPQTCRHCMFIWRPPKSGDADPASLYQLVDSLTDRVLYTGGDLSRHLQNFYDGIRRMRHVSHFAILLNGDFADDPKITDEVLDTMANTIKGRPSHWPQASILLQISFDDFHQEVIVDRHGLLKERIPVAKIANIVEAAPRYSQQIQLALLHKQTALNFSTDIFRKGVFARLVNELGERGHQVQVLSSAPSPRLKRNPVNPSAAPAAVLKDASFVLTRYPDVPILLTSSTIDGYGRASLLDEGETVKERDLLERVLEQGAASGESFDTDLMFWFSGWVTLFNAVHMCLGKLGEGSVDAILARQRKDPLTQALRRFDRHLLDLYAEVKPDLEQLLANATGPHHLFHQLTEDAAVRLHMTRRLIEQDQGADC